MQAFFTHWQRKYIGRMLTFLLGVGTALVVLWLLVQLVHGIAFLGPVLIPLAIATILAFLLEPLVRVICAKTRFSRSTVVLTMMAVLAVSIAVAGIILLPRVYTSTANTVRDLPNFMRKAEDRLFVLINATQKKVDGFNKAVPLPNRTPLPAEKPAENKAAPADSPPAQAQPSPSVAPSPTAEGQPSPAANPGSEASPAPSQASPAPSPSAGGKGSPAASPAQGKGPESFGDLNKNGHVDQDDVRIWLSGQLPKLGQQAPALMQRAGQLVVKTLGGFMGVFGILLDAIIIPIYIFFLLTEAREISKRWADYLPLKDSQFKQEIVSTLGEIHTYLVAFFRGQLFVSSIDAVLITIGLSCIGLNFAVGIGLLVLVLTFIPYLGIMICYVPALLVAVVQFGDWQHPLMAVGIMLGVQTLESTIIAPKIVGESTGLHPLTVIISVFAWETIFDSPIGALLAVPLTAALKVIMRRYVWERARVRARILPTADVAPVLRAGDRDQFGDGEPDVQAVPEAVAHPHEKAVAPPSADTANPPTGKKD